MNCPRCEFETLVERSREGVTVDLCPGCRGMWLDRGELDRLIQRARDFEDSGFGPSDQGAGEFSKRRDDGRRRDANGPSWPAEQRERRERDEPDDDDDRRGTGLFSTLRNLFD